LYSLCFYDLQFIFRLIFRWMPYGMPQWSKKIYEFYMLHEFTAVLFRNIKVCTHCAFMTLNSLLDCDLPLCYMGCLNTSLFSFSKVMMHFKEDETHIARSFHLLKNTQYKKFAVSHSTVTFLYSILLFRF
jgi:hypothetical protein